MSPIITASMSHARKRSPQNASFGGCAEVGAVALGLVYSGCVVPEAEIAAPHFGQNFASEEISFPHFGQ